MLLLAAGVVLTLALAGAGDVAATAAAAVGDATVWAFGSINVGLVVKAKSRLSVYPDYSDKI